MRGPRLLLVLLLLTAFTLTAIDARSGEGGPFDALRRGVDTVLEQARVAGASDVGEAAEREWGGYTGYFADPDGFRWEVAYNPGEIGQSVLP